MMDAVAQDVAVLSIAAAADAASTHWALKRYENRELNPVMSEPAVALVLKAASVAVTAKACQKLRKDGHGRAAKVVRWSVAALWLGVAAHNVRMAR